VENQSKAFIPSETSAAILITYSLSLNIANTIVRTIAEIIPKAIAEIQLIVAELFAEP